MKCVPAGSGLRVVAAECVRPNDGECDALLCEDELWLEPLDFAAAGVTASAVARTAIDNDQANLVFSIVTPPPKYE